MLNVEVIRSKKNVINVRSIGICERHNLNDVTDRKSREKLKVLPTLKKKDVWYWSERRVASVFV